MTNANDLLNEAARLEASEPAHVIGRELIRQEGDVLAAILGADGLQCDATGMTYAPHATHHRTRLETAADLRALCAHLGLPVPDPDEAAMLLALIRLRACEALATAERAAIEARRAKVLAEEARDKLGNLDYTEIGAGLGNGGQSAEERRDARVRLLEQMQELVERKS